MKPLRPMNLIFFGGVITLVGGAITIYGTFKQNKASSLKTDSIKLTGENTLENTSSLKVQNKNLKAQITQLDEQSRIQLTKIQTLTLQNADLSSQLTASSIETNNNITGGENYCTVALIPQGGDNYSLGIKNESSVSLPFVTLKIEDCSSIDECGLKKIDGVDRIDLDCYNKNVVELPAMTYYPGTLFKAPVDHLIVKSKEYRRLGVWMYTSKNTFYVQFAYRIMHGTNLEASYKILKQVNGKFDVIATNLDHTVNNKEAWKKLFPFDPYIPTYKD